MSFLRPMGSQWRPPYMGKSVVVSSWRGITRVQSWPRKRGIPREELQWTRLVVFKAVQAIIKWLTPWETEHARQAIIRHNRTHRGQRGSAAIRLRDWQTQRIMGRGPAFTTDTGITIYPHAVSQDASRILDWVALEPPAIIQRGLTEWEPVPNGQPGDILTAGSPGQPASWQPPA